MPRPLLVLGEALIDIVQAPDGTRSEHPGGSPANVALGLSRLGHPASFLSHLADDPRGAAIAAHLADGGVELVEGSTSAARTPTASAVVAPDRTVTYDFDLTWDPPAADLTGVTHLHLGSIAATLEPGASQVLETTRTARPQATISYDPNLRPQIMGEPHGVRARVEELVGLADVVKASDEDLEWLYAGAPVADVAHLWSQLGPSVVVVTRGPEGALVVRADGADPVVVPAAPTEVVDTVGAGDSFMSGLVSGLLDAGLLGGPPAEAGSPTEADSPTEAGSPTETVPAPPARARLRAAPTDGILPAVQRALDCARWTIGRAGAAAPTRSDLT